MSKKLFPLDFLYLTLACDSTVKKATYYYSKNRVMKLSRRGNYDGRSNRMICVLTNGAPNYQEREFIKACIKSGEPFPVRRVQLRHYK